MLMISKYKIFSDPSVTSFIWSDIGNSGLYHSSTGQEPTNEKISIKHIKELR